MVLKNWWKFLGVILVIYSLIMGLSVKVGPGISSISPNNFSTNETIRFDVVSYNASFNKNTPPSIWLKFANKLIHANRVEVTGKSSLHIEMDPISLKCDSTMYRSASLIVEDEENGLFVDVMSMRFTFPADSTGQDSLISSSILPQKLKKSYMSFPLRNVLFETIRNLNFHVPMWFGMIFMLLASFITSIVYLSSQEMKFDIMSSSFASVGLFFGLMGITTGAFWAKFTWGTFWTADPKLNGAAVAVLMYIAYHILRSAVDDEFKRARLSSVYNIFAFPFFIVLIIVLPRMADFSLHPGSGDSVGLNTYDLDSDLRKIFYPAVLGWILIGTWISTLTYRISHLKHKILWNSDIEEL